MLTHEQYMDAKFEQLASTGRTTTRNVEDAKELQARAKEVDGTELSVTFNRFTQGYNVKCIKA